MLYYYYCVCFLFQSPEMHYFFFLNSHIFNWIYPPGGSEWIISLGDYVNNSLTALGSSDPREVRLEL